MKLSLCVVAYNEEKRLPALLLDILKQTYPRDKTEILLIDSGSGDGTRGQMEQFAAQYGEEYAGVRALPELRLEYGFDPLCGGGHSTSRCPQPYSAGFY